MSRSAEHSAHRARRRRAWSAFWAAALTVLAGFVAVGEARVLGDAVEQRTLAAFYDLPADDATAGAPGDLVRSQELVGVPFDARAWRVMYRTTDVHGAVVFATGIVVTPAGPAPAAGRATPVPVAGLCRVPLTATLGASFSGALCGTSTRAGALIMARMASASASALRRRSSRSRARAASSSARAFDSAAALALASSLALSAAAFSAVALSAAAWAAAAAAAASAPGGPAEGIARMRPPIFGPRRDRMLKQAQTWGMHRLEQALSILIDTDLTLRSSSRAPAMAVRRACRC